ncbi:MAG TPA: transglutaminase family protein [Candidatus Kryptonia bacterium]|nr:transglutaminase family protein [Candidatus Kryptonia bacterium]
MRFQITHTTHYRYSRPVSLCHNEAHLRPRSFGRQRCEQSIITVAPVPAVQYRRRDYFSNGVDYFRIQDEHDELTVWAESTVAVTSAPTVAPLPPSVSWDAARDRLRCGSNDAVYAAHEFVLDSPLVAANEALAEFAAPSFPTGRPLLEAVHDLNRRIYEEFIYDPTSTTVTTPLHEVLAARRGVCQDYAHLAIGCLRSLGLPARYVSGYVESHPPEGQPQARGAAASHAWFAIFDLDAGWVDFDPTNDKVVGAQHITTAWGRDYSDVTPLKGVIFGGGEHILDVSVAVVRLDDDALSI